MLNLHSNWYSNHVDIQACALQANRCVTHHLALNPNLLLGWTCYNFCKPGTAQDPCSAPAQNADLHPHDAAGRNTILDHCRAVPGHQIVLTHVTNRSCLTTNGSPPSHHHATTRSCSTWPPGHADSCNSAQGRSTIVHLCTFQETDPAACPAQCREPQRLNFDQARSPGNQLAVATCPWC